MEVKFMNKNRIFSEGFQAKFKDLMLVNREDNVERFEEECAEYFGSTYCYAAKSGQAGMFMSVKAMMPKHGDLVILPSTSHDIVAAAVTTCKARPFFCDVDLDFCTISYEDLDNLLAEYSDKDFKLIIADHMYGNPADMEGILMVANKYSIPVMEAGINAFGARILDMPVGSFGELGVIGFFNKSIILTNSATIRTFLHEAGGSRRIDPLDAIFGRTLLMYIDSLVGNRYKKAERYFLNLKDLDDIEFPMRHPEGKHSYERFVIKARDRDTLVQHLEQSNIEVMVHYDKPLHKMSQFEDYNEISLPISEHLCRNVLSLPIYANIPDDEIDYVCEKVHEFYIGA